MTHRQQGGAPVMGELYLAGTVAPAGLYRLVGTNINIFLKEDDYLPASLDGRVACYELIRFTWQQLQQNIDGRSNTASRTSE